MAQLQWSDNAGSGQLLAGAHQTPCARRSRAVRTVGRIRHKWQSGTLGTEQDEERPRTQTSQSGASGAEQDEERPRSRPRISEMEEDQGSPPPHPVSSTGHHVGPLIFRPSTIPCLHPLGHTPLGSCGGGLDRPFFLRGHQNIGRRADFHSTTLVGVKTILDRPTMNQNGSTTFKPGFVVKWWSLWAVSSHFMPVCHMLTQSFFAKLLIARLSPDNSISNTK